MKNGLGESLELKLCYGCVCHFGETAVKTFLKLVLLVIFFVSVLINSLLFISTASMNILTGWLDKAGLDTPITQMQKAINDLNKSKNTLSQSFDEKINDWKDWYIQVDGCNVSIGKPICEIVSSPMKLICEKTDNMFYGCAEKN